MEKIVSYKFCPSCVHLGDWIEYPRMRVKFPPQPVPVFECDVFHFCTTQKVEPKTLQCCEGCSVYQPRVDPLVMT